MKNTITLTIISGFSFFAAEFTHSNFKVFTLWILSLGVYTGMAAVASYTRRKSEM